ncbi:EF-hand domain [Carpediemonas membranifera]|uniref:EF-hand domain n=1 Tax=Carpediemonas membranifera TaxID=201153 RepID=A0A8J6E3Z2_9EUKA|nr:EF-hand domain [Carpediemonas membranifera]|eukprot:KAG9396206.1 EF-hand domain [Carpediemonas membranifera]
MTPQRDMQYIPEDEAPEEECDPSVDAENDERFQEFYNRGVSHVQPVTDLLNQLLTLRGIETPHDEAEIALETFNEQLLLHARRYSLNSIALGTPELSDIELAMLKADIADRVGEIASEVFTNRDLPQVGQWTKALVTLLSGTVHEIGEGVVNMYDVLETRNIDLQLKFEARGEEMEELLKASEQLMAETAKHEETQAEMQRAHSAEVAMLTEEIGWLKSQNEKLQAQLRTAQITTPRKLAATGRLGSTQPIRKQSATISRDQKGTNEPGQLKVITVRQLRDLIEELYESKSRYDSRVSEGGQPPETMEQHLYTFLNHRYGLRQLVVDWAASIKRAIAEFESMDNDVAVFARIMRNEIDEQFKSVLNDLKNTVKELLRAVIAQKLGTKPKTDAVAAKLEQKTEGTLTEDEWVDIVKYMYRQDDALAVIVTIKSQLKARPTKNGQRPRTRVPYSMLVKALLDFQLQGHDRFLMKFRSLFRQYDTDSDGVLTREQFIELFRTLTSGSVDLEATVESADPYHHDKITFSSAVAVLAGKLVEATSGR